jgi:hypothetical protein
MNLWPRRAQTAPRAEPPPAGGAPRVRTDFEGGNAEKISVLAPDHIRFAARADLSRQPLWFYFCIENAHVPSVRCDLINAGQCLGPRQGWSTARPVFSGDERTWERVVHTALDEDESEGCFSFTVPVVGPRTWVAYCYPYTTADLNALLRDLRGGSGVRLGEIGRTAENRPIPHMLFSGAEPGARTAWVLGRQHAGEAPGSFVIDGMVRFLADEEGADLRATAAVDLHVVPMLDVDGVAAGRYGKDEQPVDFNRAWREHPLRLEVDAFLRRVHASRETQPLAFFLDVHASHHGDTSCYFFGGDSGAADETPSPQRQLVELLAERNSLGLSPHDFRSEPAPPGSSRDYMLRVLRVPSVTLEMSYHLGQSGDYLTPLQYREFGADLGRALLALLGAPGASR